MVAIVKYRISTIMAAASAWLVFVPTQVSFLISANLLQGSPKLARPACEWSW